MLRFIFRLFQEPVKVVAYHHSYALVEYVLKGMDYRVLLPPRGTTGLGNELYISVDIVWRFLGTLHRSIEPIELMPLGEWMRYTVGNLIRNYELATIESFKPKVVVSMIDNSFDYQWMSRKAANIHFMAIANSHRDISNFTEQLPMPGYHPASKYYFPHYFGYGPRDKMLFESFGHSIKNFYSVGPLRAGFYLTETQRPVSPSDFDVCLISQFELSIMEQRKMPDMEAGITMLHKYLRRCVREKRLRLCIALRSNTSHEADYFLSFFGEAAFVHAYSLQHMSTYYLIDRSKMAITLDSTAGREAFGWGKKVLFTNYSGNRRRDFFAEGPWFDASGDYQTFCDKVCALLKMDSIEYAVLAQQVREQAIDFRPERPAHKVIRDAISKAFAEPCLDPPQSLIAEH